MIRLKHANYYVNRRLVFLFPQSPHPTTTTDSESHRRIMVYDATTVLKEHTTQFTLVSRLKHDSIRFLFTTETIVFVC